MSVAIYTRDESRVEVSFALEAILLTRGGDTFVTLDLLLMNTGRKAIRRLRLVLPDALGALLAARKLRSEKYEEAKQAFDRIRRAQLENIGITTEELAVPHADENWPYRTLAHVKIDRFDSREGVVTIEREGHVVGERWLQGFIKRGWRISSPPEAEIDHWTWFLLAANEVTVFDVTVPEQYWHEQLLPGEKMWLRLKYRIPAYGLNQHTWAMRMFPRSIDSLYVFMSPRAVADWIRGRIENFRVEEIPGPETFVSSLAIAKLRVCELILNGKELAEVRDWRMILYQEPAVTVASTSYTGERPRTPKRTLAYELPPSAFAKFKASRSPIRALLAKPRNVVTQEFWIGSDHGLVAPSGYTIEVRSRSVNALYAYIAWLGFIGFVVSILNLIRAMFQ